MKLSLSVRVAESFLDKRRATMELEDLADLAQLNGYHALCMRASQIGVHTPESKRNKAIATLREMSLSVSMVTGDFTIPENNEEGPLALRDITPYLDLAEAFGCDLLRVAIKSADDIVWAQQACDEAGERGLRLAHQSHTQSLFETMNETLEVLRAIGRPGFGLIYEPANLELCGQDYGATTIRQFAPWMFNVYLQNQKLTADGADSLETWCRGRVPFDQIPVWESSGVNFPAIFAALDEIGYDGFVTIHQASAGLSGAEEAARRSAAYLRSIAHFDAPPSI
ncbi:MAG: sugar phosphate isomerase/epimerase [Candidatus Latescibacterota bacterium]|nr:sugar phosphate isomerase/epimerase [Candidatus Latescibacterota bacterium]